MSAPIDWQKTIKTLDEYPWPKRCPACQGENISISFSGTTRATIRCNIPECAYIVRRSNIVEAVTFWERMLAENPPING